MKILKFILPAFILLTACHPDGKNPDIDNVFGNYDSVFVSADLQWHKNFYPNLACEVFSMDLLCNGLIFDSTHHIMGTGYNLYLSDIFLPNDTSRLIDGTYRMDTTAQPFTFLPYMYFEGEITGTYLLDIQNDNISRIIGFTKGEMKIQHIDNDIHIDLLLFTDSTNLPRYHATYCGPAIYR